VSRTVQTEEREKHGGHVCKLCIKIYIVKIKDKIGTFKEIFCIVI
jgi:hypothetical protein